MSTHAPDRDKHPVHTTCGIDAGTTHTSARTIIHDATLATYDPDRLPDFDVFRAVIDASTATIAAEVPDDA